MVDNISGALQENLLVLLCFSEENAVFVRHAINVDLFESAVYKEIASNAVNYIDSFNTPPKEHLPDILEHILEGSDKKKAGLYENVLHALYEASNDINDEYVISRIQKFNRQQTLKAGITKAVKFVSDGDLDEAELAMSESLKYDQNSFNHGVFLTDTSQSLKFLDEVGVSFSTGIKALDDYGLGPARKELHVFIAPPKRGKTWWLIHLAKFALLNRLKVLHISLEMSETRILQRYCQSLFSISKRKSEEIVVPKFILDSSGDLSGIGFDTLERDSFADKNVRKKLSKKIGKMQKSLPLLVKQFPTNTLTIPALKSYMDMLERSHKFVPDLLIVDYADIMKVGVDNIRAETGHIYKDLRAIAVERNIGVATASQSNRTGADVRIIKDLHVADDYSKIGTADCVLTYNQTEEEKQLGLARLYVADGRNDRDKFSILMSQNYGIGQFCLDSLEIKSDYWDMLSTVSMENNN